MKCKLLFEREVMEFHPGTTTPHAPPALVAQCERRGHKGRFLFAPVGTIIDDPNCWLIVLNGQAEAADTECLDAVLSHNPSYDKAKVFRAAQFLATGLPHEDYAAWDKGEIAGVDKDGNYIPGPNWKATPAANDEEDE